MLCQMQSAQDSVQSLERLALIQKTEDAILNVRRLAPLSLYRPASSVLWWSQGGSNSRPPACKAGALPAELWPQMWWVWEDLNFRPHPYQGCALTN